MAPGSYKKHRHHSNSHSLVTITGGIVCGFLIGLWTRSFIITCGDVTTATPHVDDITSNNAASSSASSSRRPFTQHLPDLSSTSDPDLVLIGVMTARKYLNTRVLAAYNTWAQRVPGKVIFFSSEGSHTDFPSGIPLVALPGTDDAYPPQKKSFMMIKYMHDHYLHKFKFFMRADDDVYIRGDKLADFLQSINSSRSLYIGQAGQGNKEDIGRLNLQGEENFCMGGPSVVFSQSTLAQMVPHTSYCLKNMYTLHEDVEIGRCVHTFTSVYCTWAFEMQRLFLNNYKEPNGSFDNSLRSKEVQSAITLHPVKNHTHQHRIHHHFTASRAARLRQAVLLAHREVTAVNDVLQDRDAYYSPNRLGLAPSLLKFVPKAHDEVLPWDLFTSHLFSLTSTNPRRGMELSLRNGLESVVIQTMEMINKNARQRGRTIDFQQILYGYRRLNPLHGADYVLDLLLVYRKHKGKRRMTVPVRRHAYLQQMFSGIEVREISPPQVKKHEVSGVDGSAINKPVILDMLKKGIGQLYGTSQPIREQSEDVAVSAPPTIHFILPLAGRFQTFLQFMHNFEEVCLQSAYSVVLAVMLFRSELEDRNEGVVDFVRTLQQKYPHHALRVVQSEASFSRGLALSEGTNLFSNDSLLFFVDVDIYMNNDVLYRIVNNVRQGDQVYYPIVLSQYDPTMSCPADTDCSDTSSSSQPFTFSNNKGYWRKFGFGIAAMYKSDFLAAGGFDTSIQGWGKEDVDLYERFLAKNMTVFRSADPGMVHIFHPVTCDPRLDSAQYQMCLGSKASTYGSTERMAEFAYRTPEILYRNEQEPATADQDGEDPGDAQNHADNAHIGLQER